MIEDYKEFAEYLWIVGPAGSVGLSAAAIYVYLFRKQMDWTKYTLWILNEEAPKPMPYGLTFVSFLRLSDKIWRIMGLVSLIATAVVLNVLLSQIGFDFVRSILGVWFLVWLPQLFGRFTTEVGQPETLGFLLMLLSHLFIVNGLPLVGGAFALLCAFFLPIGPILAAAAAWSIWPLIGLLVPLVQLIRCRSVEPDNMMPNNLVKVHRLRKKYGFGASQAGSVLNPNRMLFPWGPLGLIFLVSIGEEADLELVAGSVIALLTAYVYSIWIDRGTPVFLMACVPVIVCALLYGRLDFILFAAFIQPFVIAKGAQ